MRLERIILVFEGEQRARHHRCNSAENPELCAGALMIEVLLYLWRVERLRSMSNSNHIGFVVCEYEYA